MSLLTLTAISKHYGGVEALKDVDLEVKKGEVHSIVGENGAGKSTLMKVISGVVPPSSGTMLFNNEEVKFRNPKESEERGIFLIHQEPIFFPDLTVLENIFIGRELCNKKGFIDNSKMRQAIKTFFTKMNVQENIIDVPMKELAIAMQQLVLIIKGLYQNSNLLIFDEPTSILSYEESQKLFALIRSLAKHNVAILYISHRIPEILELSHRITVLKDGSLIETFECRADKSNVSADRIVSLMSGRKIQQNFSIEHRVNDDNEKIFSLKNLSSPAAFQNISFDLIKGQIMGIYGLVGAGRTELAQAIIGERRYTGEIFFQNKHFKARNAYDSYKKRIVYLPEDRITQGVFLTEKIKRNMTAGIVRKLCSKHYVISSKLERATVNKAVNEYSIKIPGVEHLISSLSGGNQQKILLARCLLHQPQILILDEPTRGIDVRTKIDVYKIINTLLQTGTSIILISSELPEILSLTKSVLVMHEGHDTGFFCGELCTEENILRAALGNLT